MTKAKPAHKLRSGALTVTIWKNESDKGPWYSVTPSRSFKQERSGRNPTATASTIC